MKHVKLFEQFVNEGFTAFVDLKKAIKYHEDGNPYYDKTRLINMYNGLKSSDQTKAKKEYSEYFGMNESINEGITSETEKVANEFKKELVDMKKHFGSRLKDNTIYWSGYKKVMKASEGSEGFEPSMDGIIPMYLYWMSKYRADKSGKYTKLAMEIEKKGIKLQPMSDERDGTDNWKITIN